MMFMGAEISEKGVYPTPKTYMYKALYKQGLIMYSDICNFTRPKQKKKIIQVFVTPCN